MHTDAKHFQKSLDFTRKVNQKSGSESVFVRVHPWFINSLSSFNCGIQVKSKNQRGQKSALV